MAENTDSKDEVAVNMTQEKGEMINKTIDRVKTLNGILSILTFVLSIPVLASVIWLLYMRCSYCENLLRLNILQIGISIGLIFVFVISNVVVYYRVRFPVTGLVASMLALNLMFTVGLALVGAYKMESRSIRGTPMWLKFEIHDEDNWKNIKSCIYDTQICDDLASRSTTLKSYAFSMRKLSSLESGCCKPSESCEMYYVNATFWRRQKNREEIERTRPYDSDCDTWRNDQHKLCYNCRSCKEGFLKTLESKWRKLGVFLVVMALLLILSHILLFIFTMYDRYAGQK